MFPGYFHDRVVVRTLPGNNESLAGSAREVAPITSFTVMRLDLPFVTAFTIKNGKHRTGLAGKLQPPGSCRLVKTALETGLFPNL